MSYISYMKQSMYLGQVIFWYLIDNYYKNNRSRNIDFILNSDKVNNYENEDFDDKNNNQIIDQKVNNWNENRSFSYCTVSKVLKIIL